jgi:hypothetical protein
MNMICKYCLKEYSSNSHEDYCSKNPDVIVGIYKRKLDLKKEMQIECQEEFIDYLLSQTRNNGGLCVNISKSFF